MIKTEYNHKKEDFSSALGISNARFDELKNKVSLIGFLSQTRSEALEVVIKDETITMEEKPVACFLMGILLEQR